MRGIEGTDRQTDRQTDNETDEDTDNRMRQKEDIFHKGRMILQRQKKRRMIVRETIGRKHDSYRDRRKEE